MFRVVLVDDHPPMREVLRTYLENLGRYVVVGEAGNGEEAVSMVETMRPDAVVMDVRMPIMDGVAATGTLRARGSQAVVVTYTGFPSDRLRRLTLRAGATHHLEKPFSLDSLGSCLEKALAKRATAEACPAGA